MKKTIVLLAAMLLIGAGSASADENKFSLYGVGFYNLENLFDTCHDEGHNDYEFLPDGQYKWSGLKYSHKLKNMARVVAELGTDRLPGIGCAIIGVSEVENAKCMEDLCAQEPLKARGYQFVHVEGPDRRGVDCALFYRPDQFTLLESRSIPFTFDSQSIQFSMTPEEQENFRTRDILEVRGTIGEEMFAFYVAHLPSRIGGKSTDLRSRGAEIIH